MTYTQTILRGFALSAVLGVVAATQSGCLLAAAAGGTAATVAYVRGDTEAVVDATPDAVADAGRAAFEDMKIAVVSAEGSKVDAKVVGRTARDVKLVVVAKAAGGASSHVSVRVGNFGDSALQFAVLEKIKENLKRGAPTSAEPSDDDSSEPADRDGSTTEVAGTDDEDAATSD
jgi:hypothetical protein